MTEFRCGENYPIREIDWKEKCENFFIRTVKNTDLSFTPVLFNQPSILSSGAEHAHQIYTRGSVLGKVRIRNSEILPTPPLIFTWGQNV